MRCGWGINDPVDSSLGVKPYRKCGEGLLEPLPELPADGGVGLKPGEGLGFTGVLLLVPFCIGPHSIRSLGELTVSYV